MTRINLRHWREERDQARQKAFGLGIVFTIMLAAGVVFGIGFYFDFQKQRQQTRNNFLQSEISQLQKKLIEIRELKEAKEKLLSRLETIQTLQGDRPIIVRNFDELVRVLPDGLYYTSLSRKGNIISVDGRAQVNEDVSALMRSMTGSDWMGEPNLSKVGAEDGQRGFNLTVPLQKPGVEEKQ